MSEEGFSEKVDLPGQSDIFEALSSSDNDDSSAASVTTSETSAFLKKQISFLQNDEDLPKKYTGKVEAPIYHPRQQRPHVKLLVDITKTNQLLREIDDSLVSDSEKEFLRAAAWRHSIFYYERIADYYAHSSRPMQQLMEKSALVIIDFNSAIENGFVNVCDEIRSQYFQEYGDLASSNDGDSSL